MLSEKGTGTNGKKREEDEKRDKEEKRKGGTKEADPQSLLDKLSTGQKRSKIKLVHSDSKQLICFLQKFLDINF